MKVKLKPPYILNDLDIKRVKLSKLSYHQEYYAEEINDEYLILGELKMKKSLFKIIEENMNPTKEQVLEAASTSKEAKNALVKLFPKYFEDEKYIHIEKDSMYKYMCRRDVGKYKEKGFYLVPNYNWEVIHEEDGVQTLVPTKKNI